MDVKPTKIEQFLASVKGQMKSKEAQTLVEKELLSHLHSSKEAELRLGKTEEEAEWNAVERMGSPVKLGDKMNKLYRPTIDWWTIFLVAGLLILSFAPIWFLDWQSVRLEQQLISVILSLFIVFTFMFIDFRSLLLRWKWFSVLAGLYIVSITIMSNGYLTRTVNGKEYLYLFGITIPHIVLLLFLFISLIGFYTYVRLKKWKLLSISLLLLWVPTLLFWFHLEWVLGLQYIGLFFLLTLLSTYDKKDKLNIFAVNSGIGLLLAIPLFMSLQPHHIAKLTGFLNPEADAGGSGYIYMIIKEVLQASSWFGQQTQEYSNRIPEAHTELVLVMVTYYGGWLLTGGIFVLFMAMLYRFLQTFNNVKDERAQMAIAGGLLLLFFPFIYNSLMFLGVVPIMSVNFPLISYGGSEKMYYSFIIGFMLSVYRRKAYLKGQSSKSIKQ